MSLCRGQYSLVIRAMTVGIGHFSSDKVVQVLYYKITPKTTTRDKKPIRRPEGPRCLESAYNNKNQLKSEIN